LVYSITVNIELIFVFEFVAINIGYVVTLIFCIEHVTYSYSDMLKCISLSTFYASPKYYKIEKLSTAIIFIIAVLICPILETRKILLQSLK